MSTPWGNLITGILTIGLMLLACEKKAHDIQPPEIQVNINPTAGKTTTIFLFDISESTSGVPRGDIFCRWDWNSDGIWDTPYNKTEKTEHRFYKPGSHFVTVELLNLDKLADTAQFQIEVEQGYSNPHPKFSITPSSGHIYESFLFDAEGSYDDEDSLNTLRYQWDFNGDGHFDTKLIDSTTVRYQYLKPGYYNPVLRVVDPTNRHAAFSRSVRVTTHDPDIHVDFTYSPTFPIQHEPVVFDASNCIDPEHPDQSLSYRWSWQSDGYDTDWLKEPVCTTRFQLDIPYTVKLQVKNYLGLVSDTSKVLYINHQNQAPVARFFTSSPGGCLNTNMFFSSWPCSDFEDPPSNLHVRWDWNGDGIWDTEPSLEKIHHHRFETPGEWTVILEAQDPGGLSSTAEETIYIGDKEYESDVLLDKRGVIWEYYGIIRIGDLWWFTRNLSIYEKMKYPGMVYGPTGKYGRLYPKGMEDKMCPPGWRIPSRSDWENLFSHFEEDQLYENLFLGGKTGFSAVACGHCASRYPRDQSGLGHFVFYWTTYTLPISSFRSHWTVTFDKNKKTVIQGYMNSEGWYAIRCVKDH